MKKSNKKKIETLLLYCSRSEVAGMLGITEWAFIYRLKTWNFDERHEKIISKIKPLKQIVLILSGQFMKEHPRAGEQTNFKEQIEIGLGMYQNISYWIGDKRITVDTKKLHTIRADYDKWVENVAAVNRGEAFIRVVMWSGVPYRSPWVDVAVLTKDSGIGVQKIEFESGLIYIPKVEGKTLTGYKIAENDGLSWVDFKAWFKGYDLSKPLALIHFTKFRY